MLVGRLIAKDQATIPDEVRKKLNLKKGDHVKFEILDNKVVLSKIENLDEEYQKTLVKTLSEWDLEADEEANTDL